jgi:hypothetical protein
MSDDQSGTKKTARRSETEPEKMPAPSKPVTPKAKANPRPAPTKADIAAQKRIDKTVIKRMRKR